MLPAPELVPLTGVRSEASARLLECLEMYDEGVELQTLNFRRRYPHFSAAQIEARAERRGLKLARALVDASAHLKEMGIPFALVGGIAASARGEARFTRDLDVVVAVHTAALVDKSLP